MKTGSRLKFYWVLAVLGYAMTSASAAVAAVPAITCVPTPQQTAVLKPGATVQVSYSCSLNGHVIPDSFALRFQATSPVIVQPNGYGDPYTVTVSTPSDAASGNYSVSVTEISIKGGAFIPASNGSGGPLQVIVQKQASTPTINWPADEANVQAVPDYADRVAKISWSANAVVSSGGSVQYTVSLNGADITSADCDVAKSQCSIPASAMTSGTQYSVSVEASATGAKSVSNSTTFLWSPPAPTLKSIAVAPSTAKSEVGHTQQFTATCTFSDNKQYPCPTVTWQSSDNSTATVNADGLATAVAVGTTNITASAGSVTSGAALLTVTALPQASTPTFNPPAGIVSPNTHVTISDATAGAVIYYTTNGTTPTSQSEKYTGTITVNPPVTVKAIATATGYTQSAVGVASYAAPTLRSIVITPLVVSVEVGHTQQFTAACTFSDDKQYPCPAVTWQSSDNSTATVNADGLATGVVAGTANITASAGDVTSAPAELVVTAIPIAAMPTFSPASGTYTSAQSVAISDTTTGAAIYYTTDGTTPTTNSMLYTGSISVGSTEIIKAIAVAVGYAQSSVGSASYTINLPQVATPTFSPVGGTYTSAQSVTISDTTTGAAIYYTTDGSTPTTNSSPYQGAVSVSASQTINAIAVAAGYAQSAMGTANYTISIPTGARVVVQSYSCAPSSVYTSQSTQCQVVVENTGGVDATGLQYYAETLGVGKAGTVTGCSATLSPGQPCTASFSVTAPASVSPDFGVMFYVDNGDNQHLVKKGLSIPVIAGSGSVYAMGISCANAAVAVGGTDTCSAQIVNYGKDPVTPEIQPTENGTAIGQTATCSQSTQSGIPCTVTFQYAPKSMPSPNPTVISYTYQSVEPPSTQVTVFNSQGTYIALNNFQCEPTSVNVNGDLQCSVSVKNVSGADLSDLYYSVTGTNLFPFSMPFSSANCGTIKQKSTCLLKFSLNAPTLPTQNLQLTLVGKHNLTTDATAYLSIPLYNISSGLLSCYPWALTPDSNTAQCSVMFTDNGSATPGTDTKVAANNVNHTTTSPVGGGCNGGIPTSACTYQFNVTATGSSPQAKVQVSAQDNSVLINQQANFEYYPSNLVPLIFQCKNATLQSSGKTTCYVIFANRSTGSITPDVSVSSSTSALTPSAPEGCDSALPSGSTCRADFSLTATSDAISAVKPVTVSVKSNGSTKDKIVMLVPGAGSNIVGSINGTVNNYVYPQVPITIPFYFTTEQNNQNTYYYTLHNLVVSNGKVLASSLNYGGSCIAGTYLSGVAGCNERLENFVASNYAFLHPGDQITFYAWMTYGTTKSNQNNTTNLVSWTIVLGDPPIFSQVLSNQLSIEGKQPFSGAFMFDNNSTASVSGLQPVVQDLPAGFSSDSTCSFNTTYAAQQCGTNLSTLTPGQKCYACFTSTDPVTKGVDQYTLSGILQYAQSVAVDTKSFPVILHHRKFTVYNNCGGSVWPAFVKGAAYFYCNYDSDCPSGTVCYKAGHQCQVPPTFGDSDLSCKTDCYAVPAAFQNQLQPGNNKVCSKGCNANPGACPQGSSCEKSTGLCYWDLPTMTSNTSSSPSNSLNTYRIQSGKTAVFEFPNVPLTQAAGWSTVTSGAMYARTGCTIKDGALVCQTANCTKMDSKGACTNGPLAPATKMEYTLLFENQDYYDVGVINGFNIPISMSPDNAMPSTENPYICQAAGAPVTATIHGQPTSNSCTWEYNMINPNQNEPSQAHGDLYKAQHTYVTNGGAPCGSSSPTPYQCSGGQVCGISQSNVGNGTLTCGTVIGFWSTNQLCSQSEASTANPTIYKNICTPWGTQPKMDWLGCSGGNGSENSCYQQGNSQGQCCGCPFWSGVYKPAEKEGSLPNALQYLTQLFKTNGITTLKPNGQNLYCTNYNTDWINNILLPDLIWMKQGCTSTYTFAFDDPTSTFTCSSAAKTQGDTVNKQNYTITLCPSPGTINGKQVVVPE